MKGSLSRLLLALLAVSSAHAECYSGKTFLLQRSQGVSLEKEYVTWHRQLNMSCDDRIGGTIQVVPFYQASRKECNNKVVTAATDCTTDCKSDCKGTTGHYFGRKNGDVIENWIGVGLNNAAGQALESHQVFHVADINADGDTALDNWGTDNAKRKLADQVEINPESQSVGARFDYHQKLDVLLQGLYFKVSVPVANNKTSVHAKSKGTPVGQVLPLDTLNDMNNLELDEVGASAKEYTFLDYLAGNVSNAETHNKQDALNKAKIVPCSFDKTGVADVDLVIGYNFLQEENYNVGLNLGVTFPTGTKPTGEYMFEPRVGANHWGFGVGFEGGVTVWSADDLALEMMLVGNYRYLFKDKEMRTAGNAFKQYALADKVGAAAGTALFPLANEFTRDYDVTPGSQLDMIMNVAFTWSNFTFDLGYNLYFREEEKVELCNFDNKIGFAGSDAATNLADGHNEDFGLREVTAFTEEQFKADWLPSMQTPRQLTHKVYVAAGYNWNDWEYPVLLGVFGGYEFTDNSAMEQWSVGGKVGVAF